MQLSLKYNTGQIYFDMQGSGSVEPLYVYECVLYVDGEYLRCF